VAIIAVAALCAVSAVSSDTSELRIWHLKRGREIRGVFELEVAGRIVLRKENGRRTMFKLTELTEEDREYVRELRAARRAESEKPASEADGLRRGTPVREPGDEDKPGYLGEVERAVLAELNLARRQPAKYAEFVRQYASTHHEGKNFRLSSGAILVTREGLPAVNEAVRYLERAKPLGTLAPSEGLSLAARDHLADIGPKGRLGHVGSDGSDVAERASRHGRWLIKVGENISFGCGDARSIVMQLIIDDGVRDRGHRRNIFTPEFAAAGVAFGPHKGYRDACVVVFAGGFKEPPAGDSIQ
jgi:uncharacterized protein YkwD